MRRPVTPVPRAVARALALAALAALACAPATAGPYYVRGDFFCPADANDPGPGGTCWGWHPGNEMFDDGLHGDGAAGDGVYGAWVVATEPAGRREFKVATVGWTESYPNAPCCALANAVVFTTGPGDTIQFRFDTNYVPGEWLPYFNSVSTDQGYPAGETLEVIGSTPELGGWLSGIPMRRVNDRWQVILTIATPGEHAFKVRVAGTWLVASFGLDYNNTQGRDAPFTTTLEDADVLFQFDEVTGRVRALELGQVPARRTSWGRVKTLYR